MHTYLSFGLILRDIPNSITPQTTLHLLPIPVELLVPASAGSPPLLPPPPLFVLSLTEELAKAGICGRDRRALQQLALNVHVKHSDLTCKARLLNTKYSNYHNHYLIMAYNNRKKHWRKAIWYPPCVVPGSYLL